MMGGNLFGIGFGELVFLAILALIIFGPKRLPEISRTIGRFLRQIRGATEGFDREMRRWMEEEGSPQEWLSEGAREKRPPQVVHRPVPLPPAPADQPKKAPEGTDQVPPAPAG